MDDKINRGMDEPATEVVGAKHIQTIRYSHEAMVDLLIANPGITQRALAIKFGYTECWISTVMASDAFKMRLAARREELIDPILVATIENRFEALASKSLEVLQAKLCQANVSDDLALKAASLGAKAMGIGGNAPPKILVNSTDRLDVLAERLTGLLASKRNGDVIDVQANEVRK